MVKVGLVGYGYWGPNLTRNFHQLGNLKTCCDMLPENLEKIKALYPGVNVTLTYEEMISDPELSGIVIATSASSHFKLGKAALEAGKHVFIEKPMTLRSEEAKELNKIAAEKGLIIMVGHLLLFHPAVRYVKQLIDAGELGDVMYLYSQRLNLGKIRSDENALLSLAPHDVSVILYLLSGQVPESASCQGESYLQNDIQDVVFGTVHFPNKVMAHMHLSWLDPHKIRKMTIVGAKKMVVFDDMQATEKITIYDKGVGMGGDYRSYGEDLTLRFGDIVMPSIQMTEPLRLECRHFIECIEENRRPESDGDLGLKVVEIIERMQESMEKKGQPISISHEGAVHV